MNPRPPDAVVLWDTQAQTVISRLSGQLAPMFSPDGRRLVTRSAGNSIYLWDAATGRAADWKIISGHSKAVSSVAYSVDGTRIITSSHDRTARVWNAVSGALVARLVHTTEVISAALNADGTRAFTVSSPTTFGRAVEEHYQIWDVAQRSPIATVGNAKLLNGSADISDDGKLILTTTRLGGSSLDGTSPAPRFQTAFKIWDFWSGQQRQEVRVEGLAWGGVFGPNGTKVIGIGDDDVVTVWDWKTGDVLRTFPFDNRVLAAVLSSDESTLLVTRQSNLALLHLTAELRDFDSGFRIAEFDLVSASRFGRDGKSLVQISRNRDAVTIWPLLPRGRARLEAASARLACLWPSPSDCRNQDLACPSAAERLQTCSAR